MMKTFYWKVVLDFNDWISDQAKFFFHFRAYFNWADNNIWFQCWEKSCRQQISSLNKIEEIPRIVNPIQINATHETGQNQWSESSMYRIMNSELNTHITYFILIELYFELWYFVCSSKGGDSMSKLVMFIDVLLFQIKYDTFRASSSIGEFILQNQFREHLNRIHMWMSGLPNLSETTQEFCEIGHGFDEAFMFINCDGVMRSHSLTNTLMWVCAQAHALCIRVRNHVLCSMFYFTTIYENCVLKLYTQTQTQSHFTLGFNPAAKEERMKERKSIHFLIQTDYSSLKNGIVKLYCMKWMCHILR